MPPEAVAEPLRSTGPMVPVMYRVVSRQVELDRRTVRKYVTGLDSSDS